MQIAIAVITLVLCAGVLYWFKRSENQNLARILLLRFMNFTGIKYVLVIISLGINCRHISRLRKNMRYPILPSRPHISPLKERDIFTFRQKAAL